MVKEKDWAIKLDLADAYLHIPIHPKHRKYLRFSFQGHSYRWKVMCFGPTSAPRLFTKVVAVAVAHLHTLNIRLAAYLDDLMNLNQNKTVLLQDRHTCLHLLTSLGFIINPKKSSLIPQKLITFIFQHEGWSDFSKGRKVFKGQRSNRQFLTKTSHCKIFSPSPGSDGFLHRTSSQCSSPHETNSVASSEFLEAFQRFSRNGSSLYSASFGSSEMVVSSSKHFEGSIFKTSSDDSYNNYKCFQVNVWRAHGKQLHAGSLVREGEKIAYKHSGIKSCVFNSKAFPSCNKGQKCSFENRQHNSSPIHKQAGGGGDSFQPTLSKNMESLEFCTSKSDQFESNSQLREIKCARRSIESNSNQIDRMVFELFGSPVYFSNMELSIYGSLCIGPESSNTSQLQLVSEHSSIFNRCSLSPMGEHVCLCLSPNLLDSESFEPHVAIPLSNYINCSPVAPETLVSESALVACSMPNTITFDFGSTESTKVSDRTSQSRPVQIDGMDVIDRQMQEKGFSENSRNFSEQHGGKAQEKTIIANSEYSIAGVVQGKLIPMLHL